MYFIIFFIIFKLTYTVSSPKEFLWPIYNKKKYSDCQFNKRGKVKRWKQMMLDIKGKRDSIYIEPREELHKDKNSRQKP